MARTGSTPAGPLPVKRPLEAAGLALPPTQQRLARAQRRAQEHSRQAVICRDLGCYFMEVNRVTRASATLYDRYFCDFRRWARQNDISLSTPAEIDIALVEHFEDLYFQGHNHDAGEKVLASVEFRILKVPGARCSRGRRTPSAGFVAWPQG